MEKLIIIVIIIAASIIHSWIKRKQEEAEERQRQSNPETPNQQPPQLPAQPRDQSSGGWEEELRRLLQGDAPTPPPPRPPPSRPKPTVPPPVIKPMAEPAAPRPFLARTAIPVPEMGREMDVGLAVRPVSLEQASAAHQRASHLQASVVQRMLETGSRVSSHTPTVPGIRRSPKADRMRLLLHQKESQRTIILASVILGPPRALES
jgi:hypothetical protein